VSPVLPLIKFDLPDCPECGAKVEHAQHNRSLDWTPEMPHQGWTLGPCGHHPDTYQPQPQQAHYAHRGTDCPLFGSTTDTSLTKPAECRCYRRAWIKDRRA
jgi:hypothetical protein